MKKQNKLGQAFKEGNEIGRMKQYLKCEKLFLELEELIKKRKQFVKEECAKQFYQEVKLMEKSAIYELDFVLLEIKKLKGEKTK